MRTRWSRSEFKHAVMADAASPGTRTFPASSIIAHEGEVGGGWYVLLSGRVGVFKRDTQVAEFGTRGMILGELSSILGHPRTANLVALEDTTLLHVEHDLDQLIQHHPKVVKTLVVSLAQRLETTSEALAEMQRVIT